MQADLFFYAWMGSGAEGCLELSIPQDFYLLTKGVQSTPSRPDAHFVLQPLRQRVEARKWGFVPHGDWEMGVVSSSGIHLLVVN